MGSRCFRGILPFSRETMRSRLAQAVKSSGAAAFRSSELLEVVVVIVHESSPGHPRPPRRIYTGSITGIDGRCALAASGQAATAPPKSVTNSRRLMPSMGSYHVRSLR
jgi:hypothetical protein